MGLGCPHHFLLYTTKKEPRQPLNRRLDGVEKRNSVGSTRVLDLELSIP